MRRLLVVLALVLSTAGSAGAQDPVTGFVAADPRMKAAIASGRESLDRSLAHAFAPSGASRDGAMVKVGLPTQGGPNEAEHIWVEPFVRTEAGRFQGLLANDPCCLGELRYGDAVEFGRDAISDRAIGTRDGRLHGG